MTGGPDNGPLSWSTLVANLLHPVKGPMLEAMAWVEEPVSPHDLERILEARVDVSSVSYHMFILADAGAVKKVRQRPVRGSIQTCYALAPIRPIAPHPEG